MNISNFNFNEKIFVAQWTCHDIDFAISGVKQACLDSGRNFIAALPINNSKESLNIFNELGGLMLTLSPPFGYLFEYLLVDALNGVRVVCSGENERGDILDWYFKIDSSANELVRQGRAY